MDSVVLAQPVSAQPSQSKERVSEGIEAVEDATSPEVVNDRLDDFGHINVGEESPIEIVSQRGDQSDDGRSEMMDFHSSSA